MHSLPKQHASREALLQEIETDKLLRRFRVLMDAGEVDLARQILGELDAPYREAVKLVEVAA